MAILQALFAALGRQVGRLINTVFSWATTTLFGKVPQERQTLLSIIAFGSVIWIVVVIGVIFPKVGVFLLSFVKLPAWVQDWWIRLAMLAVALLLPAVIGFLASKVSDDEKRAGEGLGQKILHGYPYTVATSLALIMMVFFVPVLKLRTMAKRWATEHLPIIVEEENYLGMVGEIERALDKSNMPVTRTQASILLRLPIMVLTKLAGKGRGNLVADQLTTLRSDQLELILYPSDLAISGKKYAAARARAVVTEQLSFSQVYLTWTKEGNELEDRLRELWNLARTRTAAGANTDLIRRLKSIDRDLRTVQIQHEEWDVLFREKLLVERGILQLVGGLTDRLREPSEANMDDLGTAKIPASPVARAFKLIPQGLTLLGVALLTRLFKAKADQGAAARRTASPGRAGSVWPDDRVIDISAPGARPVAPVDELSHDRVLS